MKVSRPIARLVVLNVVYECRFLASLRALPMYPVGAGRLLEVFLGIWFLLAREVGARILYGLCSSERGSCYPVHGTAGRIRGRVRAFRSRWLRSLPGAGSCLGSVGRGVMGVRGGVRWRSWFEEFHDVDAGVFAGFVCVCFFFAVWGAVVGAAGWWLAVSVVDAVLEPSVDGVELFELVGGLAGDAGGVRAGTLEAKLSGDV